MAVATRSSNRLMRKTFFPVLSALTLLLLSGCQAVSYESYADLLGNHPSNRLENWQNLLVARARSNELPEDFIQPATELPLQYAIDMNAMDGYPAPEPAIPTASDLQKMKTGLDLALRSQPEFKNFLIRRVTGIYLVKNLGSSGLTGFIFDSEGHAKAGFFLLDIERALLSAEDMINFREKTIVHNSDSLPAFWGYRLSCGNQPCPGTVDALTYLLFHESGHIASEVYDLLPTLLLEPKDLDPEMHTLPAPFNQFWEDPWIPRTRYSFLDKLRFYHNEPELDREEHARAVIQAMSDGFPGLYATTDVWEHMAEVMAYSMLRRQIEFHIQPGKRVTLDPNAAPAYRSFMNSVKTVMRNDAGLSFQR